ncbi:sodium:solute symporter family transporter, partial [Pseudomonas syringae group genomosp. 7]|uniref:sodium:solute symporter family transporter n=1 Tax=Pseudomonas syringae group genomosp. 7 TaxID=251699 RepID=UPI00376F641A
MNTLFGIPMVWGAVITIGVTLIYTMKGGMKATAYSDFFLAIIMAGCFFVAIPILYSQAGGFSNVGAFITEFNPKLT